MLQDSGHLIEHTRIILWFLPGLLLVLADPLHGFTPYSPTLFIRALDSELEHHSVQNKHHHVGLCSKLSSLVTQRQALLSGESGCYGL